MNNPKDFIEPSATRHSLSHQKAAGNVRGRETARICLSLCLGLLLAAAPAFAQNSGLGSSGGSGMISKKAQRRAQRAHRRGDGFGMSGGRQQAYEFERYRCADPNPRHVARAVIPTDGLYFARRCECGQWREQNSAMTIPMQAQPRPLESSGIKARFHELTRPTSYSRRPNQPRSSSSVTICSRPGFRRLLRPATFRWATTTSWGPMTS